MNSNTFQPIRLLAPDPSEWERLRETAQAGRPIEIAYRLSSRPTDLWITFFRRPWEALFHNTPAPDVMGTELVFKSTFPALQGLVDVAKVCIKLANDISAPLIRSAEAQDAADRLRGQRIAELEARHANEPQVFMPLDREGDALLEMLHARRERERAALLKEIALAEVDAALACLTDSELADVKNRIEKGEKNGN